jgi:peptide/nickel transport system permease protein
MASASPRAIDFGPRVAVERPFAARLVARCWLFARRQPLGAFGLLIVLVLVLAAIFAGQIAPHNPDQIHLRNRLEGSSGEFWLGTDATGKDIFSRLVYGARISMMVGFGAVAIGTTGAALLGIVSGFLGGTADKVIQRFVDAWQAMPGLIILITFLGIARRMPNVNILLAMVLAIGILSIAGSSRVIRAQVLTIKNQPYVEAARCMGAGNVRIIWNCVVPNVFPLMLVSMTVALGGVILAEASLSFLGFGPAGEPSWGQMLSVDGREYMRVQPGLAIWPGVCIALAVFGFNVFGDALRDTLDPRLRGSR